MLLSLKVEPVSEENGRQVKEKHRRFLYQTQDKTFVVGFLVSMASYENMFDDLCGGSDPPMSYIRTYRTSQDHLESFFAMIRGSGGWNYNPTPYLFKYLLRKCMLMRARDVSEKANCILQVQPREFSKE
jgi:hypothetical protein